MKYQAAVTLLIVMFLGACGNDGNDPAPDPLPSEQPVLPPVSTMVMDFTDFVEGAEDPEGGRTKAKVNFGVAAVNVLVWNTITLAHVLVPVAAFRATINEEPKFNIDSGKWIWQKEFLIGNTTHSSMLTAEVVGVNVNWAMYISKDGEYSDFQWYTGQSNLVGTRGSWSLQFKPSAPTKLLDINWNRNIDGSEADIEYIYSVAGAQLNGATIYFERTSDDLLNRFYEIAIPSSETVQILWTEESKAGMIKDPNFYEDEEFHCWNEDLEDEDC
ncbi:MAG: hypothetical protein RJQ09_05415 [Cyclobacteriaceae bacterium]